MQQSILRADHIRRTFFFVFYVSSLFFIRIFESTCSIGENTSALNWLMASRDRWLSTVHCLRCSCQRFSRSTRSNCRTIFGLSHSESKISFGIAFISASPSLLASTRTSSAEVFERQAKSQKLDFAAIRAIDPVYRRCPDFWVDSASRPETQTKPLGQFANSHWPDEDIVPSR